MKKKKILPFMIMFCTSIFMCLGYVTGHYSTDGFTLIHDGYISYSIQNNLREGRVFMFLIDHICNFFSIPYEALFFVSTIVALILSCITIMILYSMIEDYSSKKSNILYVILFSMIFNFMYIENLYFVECCVMSLTLLLYTLAAKEFFKENNHHYFKSFLYVLLAIFGNNGLECYFIILIGLFSLLKYKKVQKQVFLDILKSGCMILISVIVNFVQIKLCCYFLSIPEYRAIRTQGYINLIYILYSLPRIVFKTSYLLPKYLYFIVIVGLLLFSLLYDFHHPKKAISFSNLFLILISIYSCFCISLVSTSSFGTGRLLYGVGMSVGVSLLYLYLHISNQSYRKILVVFSIIWTAFTISNYFCRTMISQKTNMIEKEEIMLLDQEMKQYEEEYHTKITKMICVRVKDKKTFNDIDAKALKAEWSSVGVVNYYTGREMELVPISKTDNQKYEKELNGKDYLFDQDTIIVKVFDW